MPVWGTAPRDLLCVPAVVTRRRERGQARLAAVPFPESPGVKVETEPTAPYLLIGGWGEVEPVPVYISAVCAGKRDNSVLAVTSFPSLFLRLHACLLVSIWRGSFGASQPGTRLRLCREESRQLG